MLSSEMPGRMKNFIRSGGPPYPYLTFRPVGSQAGASAVA